MNPPWSTFLWLQSRLVSHKLFLQYFPLTPENPYVVPLAIPENKASKKGAPKAKLLGHLINSIKIDNERNLYRTSINDKSILHIRS